MKLMRGLNDNAMMRPRKVEQIANKVFYNR